LRRLPRPARHSRRARNAADGVDHGASASRHQHAALSQTANTIFHVTQGTGETTIGDRRFSWQPGDTLAAPGWYAINHLATSDAQLFVLSDEPLLRFSNYYRFEALE